MEVEIRIGQAKTTVWQNIRNLDADWNGKLRTYAAKLRESYNIIKAILPRLQTPRSEADDERRLPFSSPTELPSQRDGDDDEPPPSHIKPVDPALSPKGDSAVREEEDSDKVSGQENVEPIVQSFDPSQQHIDHSPTKTEDVLAETQTAAKRIKMMEQLQSSREGRCKIM